MLGPPNIYANFSYSRPHIRYWLYLVTSYSIVNYLTWIWYIDELLKLILQVGRIAPSSLYTVQTLTLLTIDNVSPDNETLSVRWILQISDGWIKQKTLDFWPICFRKGLKADGIKKRQIHCQWTVLIRLTILGRRVQCAGWCQWRFSNYFENSQ